MSILSRMEEFDLTKAEIITDPALLAELGPEDHQTFINARTLAAQAEDLRMFDLINDPAFAGRFIETMQVIKGAPTSRESQEREKDGLRFAITMQRLHFSTLSLLSKVIDSKSMINWLDDQRRIDWQKHIDAGKEVSVSPQEVKIVDGQVATREQIDALNQKDGVCYAVKAREDLALDAYGEPLTDATGFNYFDKDAQERMEQALNDAQSNTDLMAQLERGDITVANLPDEKKIEFLAAQPDSVREKLYQSAGLSAAEITHTEERIAALPKTGGVLDLLDNTPAYETPGMTISYNSTALTHDFGSAANLKPVQFEPLTPALKMAQPALIPTS